MTQALAEYRRGSGAGVSVTGWELEKNIPHGSGLGAGSSDAASALLLAARMSGGAEAMRLTEVAARVGSDCAFFVHGWPAAEATGRGEVLRPVAMRPMPVVVVWPGFPCGTAEAYRALRPEDLGARSDVPALEAWLARPEGPAPATFNAFELGACERHPVIGRILSELRTAGAALTHLSGSGSACFGIYSGTAGAEEGLARVEALRNRETSGRRWWTCHTTAAKA